MATPKIDDLASREASACPSPLPTPGVDVTDSREASAQPAPLEVPKLEETSSRNTSTCSVQQETDSRRSSTSRLVPSKPKPGALKLLFAQDVSSDWWLESQLLFVRRFRLTSILAHSSGFTLSEIANADHAASSDDLHHRCPGRCHFHSIPCLHHEADRYASQPSYIRPITDSQAKATFSTLQSTSSREKISRTKSKRPSPYRSSGKSSLRSKTLACHL